MAPAIWPTVDAWWECALKVVLSDGLSQTFLVSCQCLLVLYCGKVQRFSGCNRDNRNCRKNKNSSGSGVRSHCFSSPLDALHWARAAHSGRGRHCLAQARARDALCSRRARVALQGVIGQTCYVAAGLFLFHQRDLFLLHALGPALRVANFSKPDVHRR